MRQGFLQLLNIWTVFILTGLGNAGRYGAFFFVTADILCRNIA